MLEGVPARDQNEDWVRENLRTEYEALSGYFSNVISFRFTTLGFFLAAVGLIVSAEVRSWEHAALLLVLSIGLWIVELRNRSLFRTLGDRAMQIERDHWGYIGQRAYDPFYSRMFKKEPDPGVDPQGAVLTPPPLEPTKILHWDIRGTDLISHTVGIDLIYLGVIAYATYQLYVEFTAAC